MWLTSFMNAAAEPEDVAALRARLAAVEAALAESAAMLAEREAALAESAATLAEREAALAELAVAMASQVDVAAHERLREAGQTAGADYLRALAPLVRMQQAQPGVRNVYTIVLTSFSSSSL